MRKRMNTKLASQRGASFSMALMLFLICTTMTTLILAASATTAGRLSGLSVNERRQYGAISAARLVSTELSNKVTVSQTCNPTSTGYTYLISSPVQTNGAKVTNGGVSLAKQFANLILFGECGTPTQADETTWILQKNGGWSRTEGATVPTVTPFIISVNDAPSTEVQVTPLGDGGLKLEFICPPSRNSNRIDQYRLKMLLYPVSLTPVTDSDTQLVSTIQWQASNVVVE